MLKCFSILAFLLLSSLAGAKALKVGLIDSRPFAFQVDGKYTGFHYELMESLSRKMGNTFEFQTASVSRIIKMLELGEVELLVMTDNKQVEELHPHKDLLMKLDTFVYTLTKNNTLESKNDVKGTVARLSSGGCVELSDQPGLKWIDTQTYDQAYRLLKADRVQSVCGSIAFQIVANKNAKSKNEIKSIVIGTKRMWAYSMPNMSKKRLAEIQSGIKALRDEGEVERLAQKFIN